MEPSRQLRGLLCAVATVLTAAVALAPNLSKAADAACGPSEAKTIYGDARRAFEERRFDDSIELLRKAYACDPNPTYLGNIARAYEESARVKDAIVAWQTYLAVLSDRRERQVALDKIAALTKKLDELDRAEREKATTATPQPVGPGTDHASESPTPRQGSTSFWTGRRWLALGVAGGGVLAVGVSGILGLVAKSQFDAATHEMDPARQTDSLAATHTGDIATAVFCVGAAAIVAGGVIWLTAPSARASVGTTGSTLIVRGSF
jgi:hypothetical protein